MELTAERGTLAGLVPGRLAQGEPLAASLADPSS